MWEAALASSIFYTYQQLAALRKEQGKTGWFLQILSWGGYNWSSLCLQTSNGEQRNLIVVNLSSQVQSFELEEDYQRSSQQYQCRAGQQTVLEPLGCFLCAID